MKTKLRCQVSLGQFSSEVVAVVTSAVGREFSLFTDRDTVEIQAVPVGDQTVEGWIDVDVVQSDRGQAVVRLPRSTVENGPFVTVRLSQLKDLPRAAADGVAKHDPVESIAT
jgi:hypothetical protein